LLTKYLQKINYFILIAFLFILIRLNAVYQSTVYFDPFDSPSYFEPSLSNPLRMPVISYFFSWISFFGAIVLIQSLIAILSWCFLAWTIFKIFTKNISKFLSIILIFSLGLSSPTVEHDILLLSESLTISIFNFIIGCLILYKIKYSFLVLSFASLFTLLYAGIKQSNSYFSFIILFILFFSIILANKDKYKKMWIIVLVITPSLIANIWLLNLGRENNLINNQVVLTNVIERTYDDFAAQDWWLNRGLPAIAYQRYTAPYTLPPINMTRNSPQIKAWESGENSLLLERFAISDLKFLLFAPLDPKAFINVFTDHESIYAPLAKGTRLEANNSYLNLDPNQEPRAGKLDLPLTLWWSDNTTYSKILLFVIFFPIILFLIFRDQRNKFFTLFQFFISFFALNVWAIWHISVTYELTRYLLPWAIFIRVLSIIAICLLIDLVNKSKSNKNLINSKN